MGKRGRTGNRKQRTTGERTPDLGYYVVATDTKCTERLYFQGLRDSIPLEYQDRIVLKVFQADTEDLIEKCQEEVAYSPQYRIPWIVFDRDQVKGFNDIIKKAHNCGIMVGWSNPCIEIWLFAYFGEMPQIADSKKCVSALVGAGDKGKNHCRTSLLGFRCCTSSAGPCLCKIGISMKIVDSMVRGG